MLLGAQARAYKDFKSPATNSSNLVPRDAFQVGKPNGITGKAMIEYTKLAVNLALEKKVHGSVGGPHSKKAADEAGINFTGYPYLIADMTGDKFPFLMLVAGKLRVTNVTLHVSLRKALDLVKKDLVLEAIKATEKAVQTFGVTKPKLAVSGLNPHAGEAGMFGKGRWESRMGRAIRVLPR